MGKVFSTRGPIGRVAKRKSATPPIKILGYDTHRCMGAPDDGRQGDREEDGSWLDSHPMRGLGRRPVDGSGDVVRDAQKDTVLAGLGLTPTKEQKPALRRFGRYIVLGTLGQGGMGTVLKGYDEELNRQVALKVLHPEARNRQGRRLKREAQALARLSHPNVVPVFEVAEAEGQVFVAMELVKGITLRDWQTQEPRQGWKHCVQVYLQAGCGLAAAHAEGLVHRDFKPDNCMVDDQGRVRVLDFGLVGLHGDGVDTDSGRVTEATPEARPKDDALGSSLTHTGQTMGTAGYMPIEQLDGQSIDARSDQFSFCVSLYEAVYGERPFGGKTRHAVAVSVAAGRVRSVPRGTKVPAKLRQVLLRGLAAEADERWDSMEAMLEQLRRLVVPRARRWVLFSLTVGVLGVGGGLALGQVVEEIERCSEPYRRLTNIWDDGRRQEVKASILGTELNYAPGTWERVEQRLDDYADDWASKHAEVCEASVEDQQGEKDRRLRLDCMHERARALRAAVDVLVKADAEVVENAVELVTGLPRFSRCDDLDALRAVVPPPEDPEQRREVDALREQLADIKAAEDTGKYLHALEEVEPVVERAKALGQRATHRRSQGSTGFIAR